MRGVDVGELRDELAAWLENGRRLLTMVERVTVVGDQPSPAPSSIRAAITRTPELEAPLRRLESELPTARKTDQRES